MGDYLVHSIAYTDCFVIYKIGRVRFFRNQTKVVLIEPRMCPRTKEY